MECKGTITKIEDFFCYTIIDDTKRLHWSILLAQNYLTKLPEVGSKVTLKNVHKHGQTFVICNTALLQGKFNMIIEPTPFINFVQKHNFGAADLIKFDEIMQTLETGFKDTNNEIRNKLILSILEKLLLFTNIQDVGEHQCLNKQISHFNIISVNSCRYVDIKSDKYSNFPDWSFGIHSHFKKNTVLFGYLEIQQTYGFLVLKDSHYCLPCLISKNSNHEHFFSILNSYVLIKDYKVITEIFKENVPNLEYLLVELENVFVVYSTVCENTSALNAEDLSNKFSQNVSFVVMKKSRTCVDDNNRCVCYLQISIFDRNSIALSEPEIIFLIITSKHIETAIVLTEAQKCKLYFNVSLKLTKNTELSRLASYKIYELIDTEAYFQKISDSESCEQLLTVRECKKNLLENDVNIVSFQGVLKSKKLTTNSLQSRTKKKSTIYGFGTPGSKVHQLVFSYIDNNKEIYLDCYLNNWENILMPLGVIPQMRIAVKNVLPQSRKYVKSTVFTTFEILSYEPLIDFQTVNLFENEEIDWGPRFFLGLGNKIPSGILVWGRVYDIQILSVNISHLCKKCKTKSEICTSCPNCNETEKKIDFLLKMHISDEYGQSKVLVKDPEFLKYILDLQDKQFEVWREAFESIGEYNFNIFNESQATSNIVNENNLFKNALTEYLIIFNASAIITLDLKCRKLDSNPNRNDGRTLWWYIDARKH